MELKTFPCDSLQKRFWPKVEITATCWLWKASITAVGYGQISVNRKPKNVHRLIWELYFGEIPKDKIVCHRCDIRNCCNPQHLFLGTYQENSSDMVQKGRSILGRSVPESRIVHGEKHGRRKLTATQVCEIIQKSNLGMSNVEIAKEYGISDAHVSGIIHGKYWKRICRNVQTLPKEKGIPTKGAVLELFDDS